MTYLTALIHNDVPCLLDQHTITGAVHLLHATSAITVLNLAVSLAGSPLARRCVRRVANVRPWRGRQAHNKPAPTHQEPRI